MNVLLVLPVLIPFGTAALGLASWRYQRFQGALAVGGALGLLASSVWLLAEIDRTGVRCTQIGDWPAPFGITFVADLFSAVMVVLVGVIGSAVMLYSTSNMDSARKAFGYYPLVHVMLGSVCGTFLTGDIFNLYVWFEVTLVASFVLMALGGTRQQLEGSLKYLALSLVSSSLFLASVGLLYGMTGTLNLADLSVRLAAISQRGEVLATSLLLLVAFGIKAALFPLFFWLPASYHTPPSAVGALFAGLLTKVGVYALVRVFTLLFSYDVTHTILLWAAGLTMVTGVLGATADNDFRRILAFHSVSQVGYMVMGLALFVPLALAGCIYFIAHHAVVKTTLFLVSGAVYTAGGSYKLEQLGGLYRARPVLAALFVIPALSLAGLPVLSGFFAKLILVQAGLREAQHVIVAVALGVSLLTLFSMIKIWAKAFWKEAPRSFGSWHATPVGTTIPLVALALLTVAMGLGAQPLVSLASRAGEELLQPHIYVSAVLGEQP